MIKMAASHTYPQSLVVLRVEATYEFLLKVKLSFLLLQLQHINLKQRQLIEQHLLTCIWMPFLLAHHYRSKANNNSNCDSNIDHHQENSIRNCVSTDNIFSLKGSSILIKHQFCPHKQLSTLKGNLLATAIDDKKQAYSTIAVQESNPIGIITNQKSTESTPNDNGLLATKRTFINGLEPQQKQLEFATRHRYKSSPLILALVLALTIQQNAPVCSGLSYFERSDNSDLVDFNLPYQSSSPHSSGPLNPSTFWDQLATLYRRPRNSMRQLTSVDSMNTMSTSPLDSFSNQGAILPPSASVPDLGTWISGSSQDTLDTHIKNILIPRVSGTQGNVNVRNYIIESLQKNNYHVELDEFTDSTPIGKVKFANIIATSDPNACRHLVLACHYDSKMMNGFLGASDSAVPCAMLLKMSETFSKSFRPISPSIDSTNDNQSKKNLSLMFIFFDGEEAFDQWGPTDSLYGSRHLAEKWHKQPAIAQCSESKNRLATLELFVLLDLIGTSDTSFVMYSTRLRNHYIALQQYEKSILSKAGLTSYQLRRAVAFTNGYQPLDFVQDDHVPFKKRGVPILSLLAYPFPRVWHTIDDNYSAIDFPRTRRILSVLEEFVAKYQK